MSAFIKLLCRDRDADQWRGIAGKESVIVQQGGDTQGANATLRTNAGGYFRHRVPLTWITLQNLGELTWGDAEASREFSLFGLSHLLAEEVGEVIHNFSKRN